MPAKADTLTTFASVFPVVYTVSDMALLNGAVSIMESCKLPLIAVLPREITMGREECLDTHIMRHPEWVQAYESKQMRSLHQSYPHADPEIYTQDAQSGPAQPQERQ